MFVHHIFAKDDILPPMQPGLYEYVVGANGIFVRAQRPGLEALIWVAATTKPVRGLAVIKPHVKIGQRVKINLLARMFEMAYRTNGREILFYLRRGSQANPWLLSMPDQIQNEASVHPMDPFAGGPDTLLEVHSHHNMSAFFSSTDNRDESAGFRLFAVLGSLNRRPTILARVGIYGHFLPIPAGLVFELPAGVSDGLQEYEVDDERD